MVNSAHLSELIYISLIAIQVALLHMYCIKTYVLYKNHADSVFRLIK